MKKIIAIIDADLRETPLGTRSRLGDDLLGRPVLRRTVERLILAKHLERIVVLCPSEQFNACSDLLSGLPAVVSRHDAGPSPWRKLVQTARKWSLDSWRGGVGGTTCFDEFTDCRLIAALLDSVPAEAVVSVPPSAVLFDPVLLDRMIEHYQTDENETRLVFTQAPPGVAGILLDARLVRELAEKNTPVGWLFSYKPENPRKDLVFESCCCSSPIELRQASGRLMADSQRSFETFEALMRDHTQPDGQAIGRWLIERSARLVPPFPHEVEIELTTDDPYPHSLLHPRGDRVESRGPIEVGLVVRIAREMERFDDSLIVLGGLGDPLCHPHFRGILEAIRPADHTDSGPYGLAVRTTGVGLNDDLMDALLSHRVDILNVVLDAWTPATYARLQSPDNPTAADLDVVLRSFDLLAEAKAKRNTVHPIIVPEFTKARENVHELDEFYDGWLRKVGSVTISGYAHRAGQLPDHAVIRMAPAARSACRRIQHRCVVLADGRVTFCDQDFLGRHAIGSLQTAMLEELWHAHSFEELRAAHQQGRFDATPLCAACDEWHRP